MNNHLIAIQTGNYENLYNKQIYIGFSILELSKLQIYSGGQKVIGKAEICNKS